MRRLTVIMSPVVPGRAPRLRLSVPDLDSAVAAVRRYVNAHGLDRSDFVPARVLDWRGRCRWRVAYSGAVTDSPWENPPRRKPHKLPPNFGQPIG